MVIKMNPDAFICGIMGGILGMLIISSGVIAAANNASRDCMITTRLGEVTHVRIGAYND